jgi:sigma-B regulation protein RsbU (phosphoserine phosphatase)
MTPDDAPTAPPGGGPPPPTSTPGGTTSPEGSWRDEWIGAGIFEQLRVETLAAFDRIVGLELSDVALDGIYHETHYAPMLQMQGGTREIALEIVRADGRRLPVLVNSVLKRDPTGAPVVVRSAVFDATDRREYERELLRAKQRAEEAEVRATALARTLQQTLIPPAIPDVPDLDVAAAYRPAGIGEEVGGDFNDVFEIGPGDWVVAVGDVCGKGVEAAIVTALARYTIRVVCVQLSRPANALDRLNEVLLHHETDRFCTVVILRLRRVDEGWAATASSDGHPLPLLVRAGTPPTVVGRPGSLVGVLRSPRFHDSELVLRPGDAIVLYTDGVTEDRRGKAFYGEDRLKASIMRNCGSAPALVDGIVADVLSFQLGNPRDDIALVAVRAPIETEIRRPEIRPVDIGNAGHGT